MTLTELLVVIAIMAILLGISVPTAQRLMDSFESSTGVRHLINAALSNARAIAVRQQAYAGVRFQPDKDGNTYMIFIVQDTQATGLANGFRAVEGRKVMKLPEDVGVIIYHTFVDADLDTSTNAGKAVWNDAHTFSVIFSPQGKMTIHAVRVRNKDGYYDGYTQISNDTIFNIASEVTVNKAMFCQDDYPYPSVAAWPHGGFVEETSVQEFILYSKKELQKVPVAQRWTLFFQQKQAKADFISPYTGELVIESQK
jgi:Tfp pilus assembly protein FimT